MSANANPIEVPLPSDARAPGLARKAVLQLVGQQPRTDDLLVCVSEAVANAVLHGERLVRFSIELDDGAALVSVVDEAPFAIPERRPIDLQAQSGRGVRLIDALAHDWGVEISGTHKVVWFRLHLSEQR